MPSEAVTTETVGGFRDNKTTVGRHKKVLVSVT